MSIPNTMLIAIQEIEGQIDHSKPLEEKLFDAMKKVQNHWMITDKEEQFRCAIGAVLAKASEEDREKINNELQGMQYLYGPDDGFSKDFKYVIKSLSKCQIGMQKIWQKVTAPPEPKGGYIL